MVNAKKIDGAPNSCENLLNYLNSKPLIEDVHSGKAKYFGHIVRFEYDSRIPIYYGILEDGVILIAPITKYNVLEDENIWDIANSKFSDSRNPLVKTTVHRFNPIGGDVEKPCLEAKVISHEDIDEFYKVLERLAKSA